MQHKVKQPSARTVEQLSMALETSNE